MANKRITELASATTPLAGTEKIPVVQGGETRQVAVTDIVSGRTVGGALTGTLPNPGLAAGSVGTVELATGAVTLAKVGTAVGIRSYTFQISGAAVASLGAVNSAYIPITGFPAGVLVLGAVVQVDTGLVSAGETDISVSVGDVADDDEYAVSIPILGVTGVFTAPGVASGRYFYESAYAPRIKVVSASTTLDNVSAGNFYVHVMYQEFIPAV